MQTSNCLFICLHAHMTINYRTADIRLVSVQQTKNTNVAVINKKKTKLICFDHGASNLNSPEIQIKLIPILWQNVVHEKQGKYGWFDTCDRPSILTWNWIQIVKFWAHVTWTFDGRPKKTNKAPPLYHVKLCAAFQSHRWTQTGVSQETLSLGQNWWFFVPCDLTIWRMTLKNNRAHLLC